MQRGVATNDVIAVTKGLEAGERVVTEGGDRLREGARVQLASERPAAAAAAGRRQAAGAARPARTAGARAQAAEGASAARARWARAAGVRGPTRVAMSPSRPFILRPVATSLLMVAIVLAGLVGFRFLPLSALPQVDYPTIQVQTLYPGASPEVMGNTVTAPLERQFGQMSGLERMSSTSAAGVSIITLQFSARPDARRRRAGSAGGDQRRRLAAARRPAGAAGLRQGQSRPTRRC